MDLMGLEETSDRLARTSEVRWYRHILRRNSGDALKRLLSFKEIERRGRG